MSKWMIYNKKADFDSIAGSYGIDRITARLIRNRDIIADEEVRRYLCGDMGDLHDPALLPDAELAAGILKEKISDGKHIRVIGDYDADGVTATYILLKGLQTLGAKADYCLPHRILDGYGLNMALIDSALADGVDTIITCDNGIAARDEIAYAKEHGLTVVLTDHHEVPIDPESGEQILPEADAVTDPKRADSTYPFSSICGAVVAYKVLQLLYRKLDRGDDPVFRELIECAAVATVCDVMPLTDENRIIVREGLQHMRDASNPGLRALIRVCALEEKRISAYALGFVIGPCLNATGRLDSASRAVELLNAKDMESALPLAETLKEMNDSRKDLTRLGVEEAAKQLSDLGEESLPRVLVVFLPDTHESIAGIIAGRLRENYGRPAIVLTRAEHGVKGSGRSVPAYDMFRGLSACADLFSKFGGHPMAAGLSMEEENIDALRKRLNEACTLTDADFEEVLHLDMELPLEHAAIPLIREWVSLEPFGIGNPRPLFAARNVTLVSGKLFGKNENVGKYVILDARGVQYEMVCFSHPDRFHDFLCENFGEDAKDRLIRGGADRDGGRPMTIKIAYRPEINAFRGRESVQMVLEEYMV